jgi:hypothetical protein
MSTENASVADHLALAVAAGALATKAAASAAAIRERWDTLTRAIARRSEAIRLDDVREDPTSRALRAALASALETHGATKDRDIVTTARELLALVKIDDAARAAVGTEIDEIEAAVLALVDVDVEALDAKAESQRAVAVATSRRLFAPPAEHSKTELEREALPVWQRTERFFTKALILVAIVAGGAIAWYALGPGPNDAIEACRKGDKARCWQVVVEADAIDHGRQVPDEPLRVLCDRDQDACACAGLAYVVAAQAPSETMPRCGGLEAATALDPRWPCTCRSYDFWHAGKPRLSQCGIPRCE